MTENKKTNFGKIYDKNYKRLLIIPFLILVLSFIYLGYFYSQTGEFFYKDISLTGGTTATIYDPVDQIELEQALVRELGFLNTRIIYDLLTNEQKAIIIETTADPEKTRKALEDFLGYELDSENSSFEFTGSSLSESFFRQLIIAIVFAFLFMAIVVFILFRSIIPSTAVILAAFANLFMAFTFVTFLGIEFSTAGIVALLMIIGYSVDTDILLTNRVLKRKEGTINQRIYGAFKTGMTMTLTSLLAFSFALFFVQSFSIVLSKILTILIIGLGFDIINTWCMNASIIKWYAEKNE